MTVTCGAREGRRVERVTTPATGEWPLLPQTSIDWPRAEPSSLTIARELATLAEFDPPQERGGTLSVLSRINSDNYVAGVSQLLQDWYRAIGYRLPTMSLDLAYAAFDLLGGRFRSMQRYHFSPWHRQDFVKAKRVWNALWRTQAQSRSDELPAGESALPNKHASARNVTGGEEQMLGRLKDA